MANTGEILMTALTLALWVSFTSVLSTVVLLLSGMFWINKVYHGQVLKYHNGSWYSWVKDTLKVFKWKK